MNYPSTFSAKEVARLQDSRPATRRLTAACSTNWAKPGIVRRQIPQASPSPGQKAQRGGAAALAHKAFLALICTLDWRRRPLDTCINFFIGRQPPPPRQPPPVSCRNACPSSLATFFSINAAAARIPDPNLGPRPSTHLYSRCSLPTPRRASGALPASSRSTGVPLPSTRTSGTPQKHPRQIMPQLREGRRLVEHRAAHARRHLGHCHAPPFWASAHPLESHLPRSAPRSTGPRGQARRHRACPLTSTQRHRARGCLIGIV